MIVPFPVLPGYRNREVLYQKYVVERLSVAAIARQFSSSDSSVHKYLKEFGIPLRRAATKNRNRLAYGEAWRGNKVEPHKGELETIRRMADLRALGYSYWKIAEVLNSMGVATKTRRGKWHARSVQQIIDRFSCASNADRRPKKATCASDESDDAYNSIASKALLSVLI